MLIVLHIWTAVSTFEVLGTFGESGFTRRAWSSPPSDAAPSFPPGWLYSDFFLLGNYPAQLAYSACSSARLVLSLLLTTHPLLTAGIYRFLNNPERSMGGAAFFGLALISGSKLVFTLAVISSACHWWFLSCVERCARGPSSLLDSTDVLSSPARTCARCTAMLFARTPG